ncbi:Sorbitol operon transcription regulator [Lachnospiraceae bacterium TWA4]|nr:Sorbitol operon transcription regulator [Lachnospiraceae bacterium TWA4]
MKTLFSDNRIVNIIQLFRKNQTITIGALAEKLKVSERTIRNDIKQLNQDLHNCAIVEGSQGKYRLRVFDNEQFQKICANLAQSEDFNSSRKRMDYVFGKLMRTNEPLLTDELAYEMNIGRTTLVGDIKKLRQEVADYDLEIIGKTSKGLLLQGKESDIRRYILEVNYQRIYQNYPIDEEIKELMVHHFKEYGWESSLRESFERYFTLMVDRFLTGNELSTLPPDFYNLTSHPSYQKVNDLVDTMGEVLLVRFPVEEKLFTMLPIVGMRTPTDVGKLGRIPLDKEVKEILSTILYQIKQEMNLTVELGEFEEEFLYHLMFMINRIRFNVRLINPMLEKIKEKYPLAYQMAAVSVGVLSSDYHLAVTEDEQGYLASYFAVVMAENDLKKVFKIAIVSGTGRVTARLIAMQLKKDFR